MSPRNALWWLGIFPIVFASPLNTRKPCNPANMVDDQRDWTCDRTNNIDSKGHCFSGMPNSPNPYCTSYCQMSLSKGYGQELPLNAYCIAGIDCLYQDSTTVTTTQTWTVDANVGLGSGDAISKALTGTFNAGASYSWSKSLGYTTGKGETKHLGAKQCGYWTFIPYAMTSCGTLTSVGIKKQFQSFTTGETESCDTTKDVKDVANWCNTALAKDKNGQVEGEVAFVYLDCSHGGLLQNDQIPQTATAPEAVNTQPPAIFLTGVYTGQIKAGR